MGTALALALPNAWALAAKSSWTSSAADAEEAVEAAPLNKGSREAHQALAQGFPTSGTAVLRYSGHWGDITDGSAVLDRFHISRG